MRAGQAALLIGTLLLTACVQARIGAPPPGEGFVRIRLVSPAETPVGAGDLQAPAPADGANGVDVHTDLHWSDLAGEGLMVVYDAYLEADDPTPDEPACEADPAPLCSPEGALEFDTRYYWQVTALNSQGVRTAGPVWQFTTARDPNTPVFSDDFSSDRGWVDESRQAFRRDLEGEWLAWEVRRNAVQSYYIPLDDLSGDVRLSFRLNPVAAGGNVAAYIGLAEELRGAGHDPDFPPGFFLSLRHLVEAGPLIVHYISFQDAMPETLLGPPGCIDMDCYNAGDYLSLGELGAWQRVEVAVQGQKWTVSAWDEAGNEADVVSGPMRGRHGVYRYLMLFTAQASGWEWMKLLLDDITVYN